MGTRIVYTGPHADGVAIGEAGVWAELGEPVEVETELAKRLLEQDGWERSTTDAAKEAAATARRLRAAAKASAPADTTSAATAAADATTSEEQ